jgi:hypothetical protein
MSQPNELNAMKLNGAAMSAGNLQNNYWASFVNHLMKSKMDTGTQQPNEPAFDVLIALFGLSWFESCSHDSEFHF